MVSSELLTFIEKLIERKVSQEQIKSLLMKKGGWDADEIDQAFLELEKKSSSRASPEEKAKKKVVYESPLVGTLIRPDEDASVETSVDSSTQKTPMTKTVGVHTPAEPVAEKETDQKEQKKPTDADSQQPVRATELAHKDTEKSAPTEGQPTVESPEETPPEIQEAAAEAEKALSERKSKKRVVTMAFILIVVALVGAVLAYYFFGRSISASEIVHEAFLESQKVYSATNDGVVEATFSTKRLGATDNAAETALEVDVDYNFTYDVSQTVNPIGEGTLMLRLSGLANDIPVQMRAAIDIKLIDHTLYVRFNDAKNVPLPDAVLDFRRTWIAIDLDDVADMLSTNLNEVLVERDRASQNAATDAAKLLEDQGFRAFIDRILIQGEDADVGDIAAYTFTLQLSDSDIEIIKRVAAEFFELYGDDVLAGNVDAQMISAAIGSGEMDALFLNLKNAQATIAVGKSDSLPRQLTLNTSAQDVILFNSTFDYGLKIEHQTYGFNEPVLVQINGDMITLDALLEQMGLVPVIVVPEEQSGTNDVEEITKVNL